MGKIGLIIQREYFSRVKKKSFIIMTIVGPLLMAALFIVPIILAESQTDYKKILVLDQSTLFLDSFSPTESMEFEYLSPETDLEEAKEMVDGSENYALLYVPVGKTGGLGFIETSVQMYTRKQPSLSATNYMRRSMERDLQRMKLEAKGIDMEIIESTKTAIGISTLIIGDDGSEEKGNAKRSMGIGFIGGIAIYMFIFIYGVQVLKGIIEEKTSRIVEVIISSVKPMQLMMGKIIGIASVGLTQFLLWIILTVAIVTVAQVALLPDIDPAAMAQNAPMQMSDSEEMAVGMMETINSINFPLIIGMFLFYFLGGYLLYASLFAAVGAAVDSEADTQQFMMPITIPLILSFVVGTSVIENPDGPLAFWFSVIPLTAPVVMMIRIPFGVPVEELALSAGLLVAAFIGTTYLASRIYRVGILMYGKKVTYGELFKWLRYKS